MALGRPEQHHRQEKIAHPTRIVKSFPEKKVVCILIAVALGSSVFLFFAKGGDPIAVRAAKDGNLQAVTTELASHPKLARAEFSIGMGRAWTLLQFATANRHPEIVSLLLANGADINQTGANTEPVIILAVQYSCPDCVRLLMKAGADVNVRGWEGRTSLFSAVGDVEMAKVLLDAGADCNVTDQRGETPLDHARNYGTAAVVEILSKGCPPQKNR